MMFVGQTLCVCRLCICYDPRESSSGWAGTLVYVLSRANAMVCTYLDEACAVLARARVARKSARAQAWRGAMIIFCWDVERTQTTIAFGLKGLSQDDGGGISSSIPLNKMVPIPAHLCLRRKVRTSCGEAIHILGARFSTGGIRKSDLVLNNPASTSKLNASGTSIAIAHRFHI